MEELVHMVIARQLPRRLRNVTDQLDNNRSKCESGFVVQEEGESYKEWLHSLV